MNDIEILNVLDEFLENNNIEFLDKDIEVIEDDDEGNIIEFYVYYTEPKLSKINLDKITNTFNNEFFKIKECILKNNELRLLIRNTKYKEENYLYY